MENDQESINNNELVLTDAESAAGEPGVVVRKKAKAKVRGGWKNGHSPRRGRPPGAKTKPRAETPRPENEEPLPVVERRKPIDEIADIHAARTSRIEEYNALAERHNREYPQALPWRLISADDDAPIVKSDDPELTVDFVKSVYVSALETTLTLGPTGYRPEVVKMVLEENDARINMCCEELARVGRRFGLTLNRWIDLLFVSAMTLGMSITILKSAKDANERAV